MNASSEQLNVYCIPGLGVNKHIFKNLELTDCEVIPVEWIAPARKEPLPMYALRLAQQIDQTKPFALIGVSFGGMCCIEIAKVLSPVKTILISSGKTQCELPKALQILSFLPGHLLLSDATYLLIARIVIKCYRVTAEMKKELKKMLVSPPADYFRNAINMIVHWKNKHCPQHIVHIHGTADKVIPYKNLVKCDHVIQNGSHLMVVNRAREISDIINKELKNL